MPETTGRTVKQEREARRAEKVAALKKQQATEKRNQRIIAISSIAGGLAVVGVIVAFIITSTIPKVDPASIEIEGLKEFPGLTAVHVAESVDYAAEYDMDPPAGGNHAQAWLNCGVYTEPQANENAVHSLEHGAVWVTYDPAALSADEISTLQGSVPSTYAIVSPYPDLPAPVVVSAWAAQVELDGVDDPRLSEFIDKYWKSAAAPEPGAACTGAIDGPGRIS